MKMESMNDLTAAVTAFRSWGEFKSVMNSTGYVPTLRPYVEKNSLPDSSWNLKVLKLRSGIQASGFRVFGAIDAGVRFGIKAV